MTMRNLLNIFCTVLFSLTAYSVFAKEYRMSCDFSKRESTEYITQFMGDNPWLIDVRGTVPYPNKLQNKQHRQHQIKEHQ